MRLIVYGSRYGTAGNYAEELSRKTGICVKNRKLRIKQLWHGLYIGALYAGGVLGMKKTFTKLSQRQKKIIVIAAVGLAERTYTAHR